jgi:hypothetical protein
MNRLNGNLLIGQAGSKARFNNAKHMCQECYYKLNKFNSWVSWNISNADYCEVCEKPNSECTTNGLMVTDVKEF